MLNSPWYLLLLLILPLIAWRLFAKRRQMAIRFTSVAIAKQMSPTMRQRLLWLPKVLTILSLLFLVFGLARPREGRERTIVDSEGIAIEMVVDRSGSMRALDFQIDGENVDRLTAIKSVAGKFVKGEDDLDGRYSDLVGLITFAGFADGVTPPTLDHGFLVDNLNKTQIVSEGSEDGTAIGDAIALAVEKLNALDERQKEKVKSKVIILLTDGENTAGELEPIAAAELAQTMGIKVYTIGVGTKGQAPIPVRDRFSGRQVVRWMPVNIDEATLKKVAETTDGKYFRATDTDSLTKIYEEIDELEKTKVEADNFVDYRELAVQPYRAGFLAVPPVLLIAFLLMMARVVLQNTWLKEVV
ncbi:MAG: VWA domain-containing protein [Planctomycetaceae bacterium]|nr:VWA domain-containing protein [Planctomycetaceae bacterium]